MTLSWGTVVQVIGQSCSSKHFRHWSLPLPASGPHSAAGCQPWPFAELNHAIMQPDTTFLELTYLTPSFSQKTATWLSPFLYHRTGRDPFQYPLLLSLLILLLVSYSVVSNSLWPHGLQHVRLLCPSPTQWSWVRANTRRQWRTGKPDMLQSMGLQRVGHNLVTEQQQGRGNEGWRE